MLFAVNYDDDYNVDNDDDYYAVDDDDGDDSDSKAKQMLLLLLPFDSFKYVSLVANDYVARMLLHNYTMLATKVSLVLCSGIFIIYTLFLPLAKSDCARPKDKLAKIGIFS